MRTCLLAILILSYFTSYSQQPKEVASNTIKVGALSEEVLYFGFCEGDKLIFSFEEADGKELKEIEITEIPSSSRFMDYKSKKVERKELTVNRTGIFKFRFANARLPKRICRITIHRIPASQATASFNTNVYTRTLRDSTHYSVEETYVERIDTVINEIISRLEKVHSSLNANANKNSFPFTLPENKIASSYYIGVDQSGEEAWRSATTQLSKNGGPIVSRLTNFSPGAALALGLASNDDTAKFVIA